MTSSNVSKRKWINWHPTTPETREELTSTLVLTSRRDIFVDVRLYTSSNSGDQAPESDSNLYSGVEWAFAGTARSKDLDDGTRHCQWSHWVDSKVPLAEEPPVDQGVMTDFEGNEMLQLEKGEMANPATGVVSPYEELWEDVAIEPVEAEPYLRCVVLVTESTESATRGVVIRLGRFCQGILKIGEDTTVERWEWNLYGREPNPNENKAGNGVWRQVRYGQHSLPCAVATSDDVKLGQSVKFGAPRELRWVVHDVYDWSELKNLDNF
ncbi:hypothetical protein M501DRAFT_994147 [Patellaria atrata CBS 101060]|uniref:Protein HRI1 n=1 Tax=Patellaria atrata CBS 101060 TaxID=1346257 RepID=A0A9P4SK37_9PEZI|nr:hypothetical protein M501DRAFT_994147 [Patellaria atrata CBS 101060]